MESWRACSRLMMLLALHGAALTAVRGETYPDYIRVDSGQPVEIYHPGEPVKLTLEIRNPAPTSLTNGALSWAVRSWATVAQAVDPVASGRSSLDLSPAGRSVFECAFTPTSLGWHEVTIELRDTAGAVLDRETYAFSVGDTAKNTARNFRYGVCAHLGRLAGPMLNREVGLIDRLGVSTVRTELFAWDTVEKTEGNWNFSKADAALAAMEPTGVDIQHMLDYSTRWGSTGDPDAKDWKDWFFAAPRLEPWLNYVHTVLTRYGDHIKLLEIWNEPDIEFWRSPTDKYVELFDATSKLIKTERPKIQVINGGLAYFPQPRNPDFVQRFVVEASKANWDIYAYHDYQTFAQFLSRRGEVTANLAAVGKPMPLWVNEGGYHTLLGGGERGQALTLVKKLTTAPAYGVSAYFWYNLIDGGTDPEDSEDHFGLVRHNGQPKAAWSAYQALIRELGDARYLSSMTDPKLTSAGVWAHLYERPSSGSASRAPAVSTHVLVLWQEGESRRVPSWLGVGGHARVTRVTDIMGNVVAAPIADQGVVLALGTEPLYVHIQSDDGSAPALQLKPLLEVDPLVVLVPGGETQVQLGINNPLDVETTLTLTSRSDLAGLQIAPTSTRITLPPHGIARTAITLKLPASGEVSSTEPAPLSLSIDIPDAGLVASATIPLSQATPLRRIADAGINGVPPILLNDRNDIHNLYSAQPRPDMHWSGAADLGGEARIAYDDTGLLLQVSVRDDQPVQTSLTGSLWKADSLQLGLRLNDATPGYLEIGLARLSSDGSSGGWVFSTLPHASLPLGRLLDSVRTSVDRDDATATTTYRLHLPWTRLGLDAPPKGPFRLNFIVNDDDGLGRKQWLKLSDGLGEQKAPQLWRIFVCQ